MLYPPTKNAAQVIVEKYTYGDVVPDSDLLDLLEVSPEPDKPMWPSEYKSRQLKLLKQVEQLKTDLLENHNMMLIRSRNSGGMTIVKPKDQTRIALNDYQKSFERIHKKAAKRLSFIDRARLSNEQIQENVEAMAKVKQIARAGTKVLGFSHEPLEALSESNASRGTE